MNDTTNNAMLNIVLSGTGPAVTTTTTNTNGIFGTRGAVTVTSGGTTEFATSGTSGTNPITQYTGQTAFTGTTTGTATNYSVADSQTLSTVASTPNSIKITTSLDNQSLDLATNTMKITSGGILFTGSNTGYEIKGTNAAALSSGTSATTADLIIHNFGTGGLKISSVIANGGSGAQTLSLDGTGTTTLTGVNTFTGVTYAGGGAVLSIGANSGLGAVATGAGLTLNNATLQATGTFALDNSGPNIRPVALGAGGGTFDVTGSSTLTVSGAMVNSSSVSAGSLTKIGTGTLLLTAANTYSGGFTNIQNGTIQTGLAAALPAATIVGFGTGSSTSGTLALGRGTTGYALTVAGLSSLSSGAGTIIGGTTNATLSTLTYTGTVAVPTTFSGTIGASGDANANAIALAVTAGQLTLSGANTYTGGTTLSGGVLNINGTSAIGTGTLAITGASSIDNTSSGGAVTLSTNNTVTLGNALTYGGTQSLNFGSTSTVSEAASQTLTLLGGTGSTSVLTFGKWNFTAAAQTLTVNAQQGSGTSLAIGTLDLNTGTAGVANIINGNGNLTVSAIQSTTAGAGFTYNGNGVLTLAGSSTTTGTILVGNGTLKFGANGSLAGALNMNTATGIVDVAGHTVAVPSLAANNPGGRVTSSASGGVFNATLAIGGGSNTTIFDGTMAVNLTAPVTLSASTSVGSFFNTGDVTLTNASTTALGTQGAGNIANTGNLILNANNTGAINISSQNFNPTGSITNSGTGTGTTTISVPVGSNVTAINNTNASPLTISGPLFINTSGSTTVTESGSGLLTLSGGVANTTGNLVLANNSSIANGITLLTGTSIVINNVGTITNSGTGTGNTLISAVIGPSVTGLTQASSTSGLTISGANTFTGNTLVSAGVLTLSGNTSLQNSTLDTSGAGTITATVTTPTIGGLTGSKNITSLITSGYSAITALTLNPQAGVNDSYSGAIANGTGTTLTKTGLGTQVLSGNNTFTGAITVSAGTLNFTGTNASTGALAVGAGTLVLSGASGSLLNISTVALNSGSVLFLDNTGAGNNVADRLKNGSAITMNNGSSFNYLGSDQATTNSSETIGTLTFGGSGSGAGNTGMSTITVGYNGTNAATVTASAATGGFTRATPWGGIALINGTNLGANAIAGGSVGQFITTTAPTLVGTTAGGSTGINSAKQDTKIALFLLGESGVASGAKGTATGTANTFLTYDAAGVTGNGYRPLNPTDEFTNNAITAATNTYLTTGTTTTSGTTAINSLVVNGGNLAISSGNLTNTSGMLLFAGSNSISGAGTFTLGSTGGSGNLEGIVEVNSGVNGTISSALATATGATGLTVYGPGTLTLTGTNSYSGTTAIGLGSTVILGNNSALGSSTITATGGTLKGDGQPRTISNTLANTQAVMILGGASDLTFTGGGTVSTSAFTDANFSNAPVVVNNSATTTFSGVFSLLNAASGVNNSGSFLSLGSSANVVISGPIQDNNAGNAAGSTASFTPAFTGAGANLTINPTTTNNGFGAGKGVGVALDASYNTITIGGPGGTGASITPFGPNGVSLNSGNTLYLAAATNGQILSTNVFAIGGSGTNLGFVGANSITLGGAFTTAGQTSGVSFTNLATGTFTFGNTITITGGSLLFQGTGPTTLNSSATVATGAFPMTATQSGTLTLSNTNNLTGITTFNGGTVVLDYSTNNTTKLTQNTATSSAAALTLAGANVQLSGGSYAQTLGTPSSGSNGTTLNYGQSKITRPSGTATIALGPITRAANSGGVIDFASGVATTTTGNTSGILGGWATVGSADWASVSAGSIVALSSYDSFATPGANKNILQTDTNSVAGQTISSLKIATTQAGQSLTLGGNLVLSNGVCGGLLFTGNYGYTITGGNVQASNDVVIQNYGSGTLTINSTLSTGSNALTIGGTGTTVLGAINPYTGATFLTGGIVKISDMGALGATTTTAITINGGTLDVTAAGLTNLRPVILSTNGGTIQVDTGTLTFANAAVISGGTAFGGLTKTGAGTLLLQAPSTFVGPVTVLNGTLQLGNAAALGASSTASNRSTAPILVNGGTLDNNGQTTALGNVTLQSGAITDSAGTKGTLGAYSFTLQSGSVSANLADVAISGNTASNSINVYKTTGGTVTLTGANTYTGSTIISAGMLQSANSAALGTSGGVAVNGTGTLAVNYGGGSDYNQTQVDALLAKTAFGATTATFAFDTANGSGAYGSALTMAAGITKLGANTLTLTGPNSYTGGTTVSAGTLSFANGALGSTGNITVNGATLQWNGSNTQDISSRLVLQNSGSATLDTNGNPVSFASAIGSSSSSSVTKSGAGTLTLTGTQTYTGATNVTTGTLVVNGTLQNGGVTVNSGATLKGGITAGGTTSILSGGTLSVGNSPGTGNFATLNLAGTGVIEFNASPSRGAAGTAYDTINISTAIAYGGELRLTFAGLVASDAVTPFTLFQLGSVTPTGDFGSVTIYAGATPVGSLTETSGVWTGLADLGYTGGTQQFTFTQATGDLLVAVPEPATWGLLAFSLTTVMVLRRRKS